MISIIQAIILGIIQGITEWLPVSSQGQLMMLMMRLFNISFSEAFNTSILLHFGTMLAAAVYFRSAIMNLFKDKSLVFFITISTLLSVIIGGLIFFFLNDLSLNISFIMLVIGILLIITGIIQKYFPKSGQRTENNLKPIDGIILGLVQGFSLLPGLSRSGLTTSTLLFRKFGNQAALKLSFLMGIPVVFAATVGLGVTQTNISPTVIIWGNIISFVIGIISIHLFMRFALKLKFWLFCIIMGILIVLGGII
jgi:undecaprenyl-diphosphatase